MKQLLQISVQEATLRINKIQSLMAEQRIDAILISDNANKFYTSGRVFNGYTYIPAKGQEIYFVRRPVDLTGNNLEYIHKPENIIEILQKNNITEPSTLGIELDLAPYSMVQRIAKIFSNSTIANASGILRQARSVKSEFEIEQLKTSGIKHTETYSQIKSIYSPNITDLEFQVEIERLSRLGGCLGQFRISGDSMEIYMGNVICGV